MKKNSFFSKYGAYIVAAIAFVAVSLIYCKPELQGRKVFSGDSVNATASVQEGRDFHEKQHDRTFWTGSMFSGMPNYQVGGYYYTPDKLIRPIRRVLLSGHRSAIAILLIFFICFYILFRSFKIDKWLSIAGAFATGFSSYFLIIIAAGHNTKTSSIALMAVVAAGMYLIYRKKYGAGAVMVLLGTAIGFGNHPQMSYYMFMLMGLFFLAEIWIHIKEKRLKDFAVATLGFVLCVGVGMGTGSANIFSNKEYAEQTMRGGHSDLQKESDSRNKTSGLDLDYATQWSYGIDESLSFMIPGFKGGSSNYNVGTDSKVYDALVSNGVDRSYARQFCQALPIYWGDQPFTAGNVYMGAIVCFLFILGLLIVTGPYKWALLIATLFSVMLSWGYHFMPLTEFFFKYFPLYSKFRAVSSILIVAEITMPLLGFLAIKAIMDKSVDSKKIRSSIFISAGVTAGICLIFALFGNSIFDFKSINDQALTSQLPDWLYMGILQERASLLTSDSWRSLIFIVLAAAVLLLYNAGKLKQGWMTAAITVLVLVDMWPVDRRYFNDDNFISPRAQNSSFAMQPYEKQILDNDDDPNFRVFNITGNPFNEARTSYYLKSVGGYSAAKLRRYQDLIDEHLSKMEMGVLNMLNTKYFIIPDENGEPVVQYNPDAMGNAWFVDTLIVVDNANQESDALSWMDLTTTAVLDKEFAPSVEGYTPGHDEEAFIELTKYTPRSLDYDCHASQDGVVVFSEIYYPYGWKASIDGKPADHFRANYTLRAMNVPAGDHQIHFEFDPDSVRKGETVATICVILMYLAIAAIIVQAVVAAVRKKREKAA